MVQRGGVLPDWAKGAVSYRQMAGGLGLQVHAQDNKLHLHQFTLVGYGRHRTAQEWFWSQQPGFLRPWRAARLGAITSGSPGELVEGPRDWACAEYAVGQGLSLCLSRLCPAVLVRTKVPDVTIFDGIAPPTAFAYSGGEAVQVRKVASAGPVDLGGMSQPWLLCWFGQSATFSSCRLPQTPYGPKALDPFGDPGGDWYEADLPVLLVFQSLPQAVERTDRGLKITLAKCETGDGWASKVALLPPLGELLPRRAETLPWTNAVPDQLIRQCRWWSQHFDQYPLGVVESYARDPSGDSVVTETFTHEAFRPGKTSRYAPVPPMLALAQAYGFPVECDHPLVETGVATSWGPAKAIENVSEYRCRFKGLEKYVYDRPVVGADMKEPESLRKELETKVTKVVTAGHLAPHVPLTTEGCGRLYMAHPEWASPGDGILHTAGYLPLVNQELRGKVVRWMTAERREFPPEKVLLLEYVKGTRRERYPAATSPALLAQQKQIENGQWLQPDFFHKKHKIVPIGGIAALAAYADTVDNVDGLSWDAVQEVLNPYLARMDWPSMGYVTWEVDEIDGQFYGLGGVMDANRLFAALSGTARLARRLGNREAEAMALGLFSKTAALRFALGKYTQYLYDSSLKELPKRPDFLLWIGSRDGQPHARHINLYTPAWQSRADDIQQVVAMDEFGTYLHETCGTHDRNDVVPFRPMTPALARFLGDFLKPECHQYVSRVEYFAPDWYCRYSLTCLGSEAYALPMDASWQIFLAKAWILGQDGPTLEKHLDMPWLKLGDFYYMDKLAATIVAYRGVTWDKME
jgi:hypothetical protein